MGEFYRRGVGFIVTMRAKGGNTESFVVAAEDDAAVRDLLRRHHAAGDRKHYRAPGGGRVDVVWRNIAFPEPLSVEPVPCTCDYLVPFEKVSAHHVHRRRPTRTRSPLPLHLPQRRHDPPHGDRLLPLPRQRMQSANGHQQHAAT